MPNVIMAKSVYDKMQLYFVNKEKTKQDLENLKRRGLVPIINEPMVKLKPKAIEKAKGRIVKQTVNSMGKKGKSCDYAFTIDTDKGQKLVYDHLKLMKHSYYPKVTSFINRYKNEQIKGGLTKAVQMYGLNGTVALSINKLGCIRNGYIDKTVSADQIIAGVLEYWKNKLVNLNHFTDIIISNVDPMLEDFDNEYHVNTTDNIKADFEVTIVNEDEALQSLKTQLSKSLEEDNKALFELVNENERNVPKRPISLDELETEISKRQRELMSDSEVAWATVIKDINVKITNLENRKTEILSKIDELKDELVHVSNSLTKANEIRPIMNEFINL
ncbi:MAG: hypothetical protein E6R13_02100 [Spirochaetes bacterium]|nr:MAG: hypothetical protein E6R13_02100 [Spirochaetota bacterium]